MFWWTIWNLVNMLLVLKDSVNVRKIFLILNPNRNSPLVCLWLRILINVWRIWLAPLQKIFYGFMIGCWIKNLFRRNFYGSLKVIFPQEMFLKIPIPHLRHKALPQTNFYVLSKFAEHLQHYSDIERLLKQIWSTGILLNW